MVIKKTGGLCRRAHFSGSQRPLLCSRETNRDREGREGKGTKIQALKREMEIEKGGRGEKQSYRQGRG